MERQRSWCHANRREISSPDGFSRTSSICKIHQVNATVGSPRGESVAENNRARARFESRAYKRVTVRDQFAIVSP